MKKFYQMMVTPPTQRLSSFFKITVLTCITLCVSLSTARATPLSGNYTIDASGAGNYKTFSLAATDLATNGISGPVIFNVTAASYTETVTIGSISGVSSTNTITFRGKGRSATTLTSAGNTVNINGASYIGFDQMSIITTSTTGNLINAQSTVSCSITNCIVKGPLGAGILYLIYDYTATGLTVNNNNITGGYYGLYSYGSANSAAYGKLTCTNNRFSGQQVACYYGQYSFQDNFSYNVCDSSNATLSYVMFNQYENGPTVTGNKFYAASVIGLDMIQENFYPVSGKPVTTTITNNFFTNSTTGSVFDNPQYLSASSGGWVFAFNTIYNTTGATYAASIQPQYCAASTCVFASNIIVSTKGTNSLIMNATSSQYAFSQFNGNDINYTIGTISFTYGTTTTTYSTYALYSAAVQLYGYDLNGTNFNPTFKSIVKPFDLHLSTTVAGPVGVSVSGITTDIDQNTRYKLPSAGASESSFGISTNNAGVVGLIGPKNPCPGASTTVSVDLANLGTNAITGVQIGWSVDGTAQSTATYSSTIPVYGDVTVSLGSYTFGAGATHKLKAWPIKPNGVSDTKAADDTLFYTVNLSLSGTYTLNATGSGSTNFTSFTAAAAYLNNYGVCGPVTINVVTGTYTEIVSFSTIPGVSATNTVTFRGTGRSNTILTSAGATLNISGQNYLAFDQMTIATTIVAKAVVGVYLINEKNATNCSITNCIVKAPTGTGILYLVNDSNGNNNTVFNCNLSGGYYGMYSYGTQASAASGSLQCTYNRFSAQQNACYYGLYSYQDNFSYNVCDSSNTTLTASMYSQYENGPIVNGNKFYATATTELNMLQENFYPVSGKPQTAYITNNFFVGGTVEQVIDNPQNLSSTSGNWVFAFNTIYNTTASTYAAAIEPQACGASTCTFASNIIFSTKGTPLYMYALNSTTAFAQYDGNDINFSTGSVSFTYGPTTTTYASYALYIAAAQGYGYDLNGTNFSPTFVSTAKPYDMHLSPTVQGPIGVWAAGITTDIDKNQRIKYTAAGAAESFFGGVTANDAGVIGLVSPKIVCPGATASVVVDLANLGSNAINSIQLGWSWDGAPQTPISVGAITLPNDAIVTLGTETFTAGASHKLKAWPIKPNGVADGKASNDTLFATIAPALPAGTYTINSTTATGGTNFASFTAAVSALNNSGICGPVVFKVSAGTYTEQVQLNSVVGASATNTITFDGNDSSKTILTYSGTAAAPHTFRLNGASYVTLKRMSITNPSTTGAFAVHITGGASYNTVTNCILKVDNSTNNTGLLIPVAMVGATYTASGNSANYNTINNNIIIGGWANVAMYGTSATALCMGNQITNNVMTGGYLFGVNATFEGGFAISNNNIALRVSNASGTVLTSGGCIGSFSGSYGTATTGISAVSCTSHTINANVVNATSAGILDQSADVSIVGGKSFITNNMVKGLYSIPYPACNGIYLNVGYNTAIYHNTIYFVTPQGNALQVVNTTTASQGADVRDNIIYKTASCAYVAMITNAAYVTNLDYNDYYSTGGNFVNLGGVAYTTLATLKAGNSSFNQNCWNVDPGLANLAPGSEDLHLGSSNFGLYGVYVGVDKDIDGDPRCKNFPNIGADETKLGKGKPIVKFFLTSNIYPGSPSFVFQTAKFGEPKTHKWFLNGVEVSDSVVLKTTAFVVGTNTLKLVTQYCGGADSFTQTFTVAAPTAAPNTDFISNKNYIAGGDIVNFQDMSTNGPVSWKWEISPDSTVVGGAKIPSYNYAFGSSAYQNPQVQFIASGKYNVCLTPSNSFGKGTRLCKISYINVLPAVALGTLTSVTDAEGYLYDDGGPTANYLGAKGTPSIVIAPCADSVYLTFSAFDLNCGISFLQLYEGKTVTGRRLDPCGGSGLTSGFTGGSSGGTSCATACMPNVLKPDTFRAKSAMTIQMNDGTTSLGRGFSAHWWSKPLSGLKKAKASFTVTASHDSVCTNGQTNFVNTSTPGGPGDIINYLWDLDGDPTTFECVGACATAIWPYFTPGPIKVTLIANSCGGADTFSRVLTVYDPAKPKTAILADNVNPTVGSIVFFSAPIKQCVDDYVWTITKSVFTGNGTGYASYVNGTNNLSSNPKVTFSDTGYYDVKLYVDNLTGQQQDSLTIKKYIHARAPYCVPDVATMNQGLGISKITLNTLTNSTTQAQQPYTDFTSNQLATTTLAQGVKYPLTISRNPSLLFEPINRTVYIDWNEDGVFSSNEVAANDSNSFSTTFSGSITVPRNAKIGATTMRVAVNRGIYSNKPCGQNEFGEYQDFRIYVIAYNLPPVITLKGHQGLTDTIKIEQGHLYIEPGYTASSYLYGNMTPYVKRTSKRIGSSNPLDTFSNVLPATYLFSYNLTDSIGNKAITQFRVVQVTKDNTPPALVIAGPDTTIMEVTPTALSPFPAPKVVSALDQVDGDLSGSVVNDASKVTSNILGLYVITYTVSDINGNVATVYRYVKIIDTISPKMKILGKDTIKVEVKTAYADAGVSTSDNYYAPGTLGPLVKVNNGLNLDVLGTYTITYNLTDPSGNVADPVTRTVIVIDTVPPMIILNGPATDSLPVFKKYKDPGVNVTDNYYTTPDINLVVTGTFYTNFPAGFAAKDTGSYTIIYTATDKSGNTSSVTRIVLVKDITPPIITLKGDESVAICRWFNYQDAGYDVSDDFDNQKDIKIDTLGNYYPNGNIIQGIYTIRFKATDKAGNSSISDSRTIWVKPADDQTCVSGIAPGLGMDSYVKVYPNPNTGLCTVDVNLPAAQRVRMSITNMLGQEIELVHNGVIGQDKFTIDLSNQQSGIYFLNIVSEHETLVKRIEVTK